MLELHTPILIACNKSDLASARSEKSIVEEIEREMEQMRVSRGATLEGQDQADSAPPLPVHAMSINSF